MSENEEGSPWSSIGWGIFLVAVGIGLFFYFGKLEQEGGSIRMNVIILMIYKLLGRYGVLGVLGGLGALMTFLGIKDLVSGKS